MVQLDSVNVPHVQMVFMLEICSNLSAFGWSIRRCWLEKCKLCLLLGTVTALPFVSTGT